MKGERTGENITYQWTLRALGAYLDDQRALSVSVIETPEGLAVRFLLDMHDLTFHYEHIEYDHLAEFKRALQDRRTEVIPQQALAREPIASPTTAQGTTYQDFFRALGWELDDMNAYNIVVDEVDGGMLVTYLCFDPTSGYIWQKRMANLDATDKRAILTDAYSRRRQRAIAAQDPSEMVKLIG